jgi:hypothetical protein
VDLPLTLWLLCSVSLPTSSLYLPLSLSYCLCHYHLTNHSSSSPTALPIHAIQHAVDVLRRWCFRINSSDRSRTRAGLISLTLTLSQHTVRERRAKVCLGTSPQDRRTTSPQDPPQHLVVVLALGSSPFHSTPFHCLTYQPLFRLLWIGFATWRSTTMIATGSQHYQQHSHALWIAQQNTMSIQCYIPRKWYAYSLFSALLVSVAWPLFCCSFRLMMPPS